MKFHHLFFISTLSSAIIFYVAALIMIGAPIRSEYWVNEMLIIKKHLVKQLVGEPKLIIAGGSSTLFGIDAEYVSQQLKMPVINFGLHAALPLEKILKEVSKIAKTNDSIVLQLEPGYYNRIEKLGTWQIENVIAWDHSFWETMSYYEKTQFLTSIPLSTFGEMVLATAAKEIFPSIIRKRLNALDAEYVISKFNNRPSPSSFEYSAYNLNNHGDMTKAEGSLYQGLEGDIHNPSSLSDFTSKQLIVFVQEMKLKKIKVYFANAPYLVSEYNLDELRASEALFSKDFEKIGFFIDKREDLTFERSFFFDTNLHLNTQGRSLRTELLISSLRNKAPEIANYAEKKKL